MKTIAIVLAGAALLVSVSAVAQIPTERTDPGQAVSDAAKDAVDRATNSRKPAIKSSKDVTPGAPVAGANSFTEGQARSRIEARGYTEIGNLAKDEKGIWHGTAVKAGKPTHVALDYQGNVVESAATSTGSSSMPPNTSDR